MAAQPQVHAESAKNLGGTAQGLFLLTSRTQFLHSGLTLLCLSPAGPHQDTFTSSRLSLWSAVAVFPGDSSIPESDESLPEVLESFPSLSPLQRPVLEVSCFQGEKKHSRNCNRCRGMEGHCEARIGGQDGEAAAMPGWGTGKTTYPDSLGERES